MQIGISQKGPFQVLTVNGKIRLQNWRVLDKHLHQALAKGNRKVVLDLSEVSLMCTIGVGSILHNVAHYEAKGSHLLVLGNNDYVRELFDIVGGDASKLAFFFADWGSLERAAA
jgi:anti-anti-sigma factor